MEPNVRLYWSCVERRDGRSWEEFVSRFGGLLRRKLTSTLRRLGRPRDREQLEDLVQELYCRLLSPGARSFRGRSEGELVAYLGRIAERVVLDRLRAAATRKRGGHHRRVDEAELELLRDLSPSPEERVLALERRHRFARRCRRILTGSQAQRDLRILRWWVFEGWSSREIAAALGDEVSPGFVDSRVHRLRRKLASAGLSIPRRLAS